MFAVKWSSPEVIVRGEFSTKSDVWAFGVLMIEVFNNGETPYQGLRFRLFFCPFVYRFMHPYIHYTHATVFIVLYNDMVRCPSHADIVSKRIKTSNFFIGLVAHHCSFPLPHMVAKF